MPASPLLSPADARAIAVNAAASGGTLVRHHAREKLGLRTKSSQIDFVTEADIASGVEIVRSILAEHPEARFVVEEEEVYSLADAPRGSLGDEEIWVIDPIDGTTSFIHGYPCYSVSVALVQAGRPVAGAVYNAAADEMFSAGVGLGAHLDGKPIHAATAAAIPEALLITGFPYDRGEPLERQLVVLREFLRAPVHGIRRDGSAAMDCCHVAAGRADGFWEFFLKPWDMAAGVVILREAGARVTDTRGSEWSVHSGDICCANPKLHGEMLRVIGSTE